MRFHNDIFHLLWIVRIVKYGPEVPVRNKGVIRSKVVNVMFSDSFPGIETIESAETYETKIERPTLLVWLLKVKMNTFGSDPSDKTTQFHSQHSVVTFSTVKLSCNRIHILGSHQKIIFGHIFISPKEKSNAKGDKKQYYKNNPIFESYKTILIKPWWIAVN